MSCRNLIDIQQLTNLKQTYLITVAILEGRYYVWPNMDSVVIVQALGKKEKTAVVKNSDCPYYNEYFTFDKKIALHDLLNTEVIVTVIQPKSIFRKRKILGLFRLDVATIWAEPEHQFFNKWAVLNAPTNKEGCGSRGFLKVNLTVITKNVSPGLPPVQEDNEIEGNLLLPHSRVSERFRAKFEFDIFRAEHLYDKKKPPSSHVVIAFGGNMAKTSVRKNTSFPEFNERIVIHDMYPVLCHRIHVRIYFGSNLYAEDFLPLSYVTSEDEEGFLPKFGPAFLHMYDTAGMEEYKGSILFSLRTKAEVVSVEDKEKNEVIPISPSTGRLLPKVILKFFIVIFESSALDKRFDGKISYRVSIGNTDKEEEYGSSQNSINKYISDKIDVRKINRNSYYSVIRERKPLLTLSVDLMDFRKRLYNLNMLEKIYDDLVNINICT
ncbi:otoferlin-like [Coccinella septempunctata]|uniref:otoferlin-like n=1 Tax=Coccinella septempunctata TaxID=41139 RepID=UPI001D08D64E|nr:otoferlin-like [Coccinella septempunctata]